MNDRNVRRERRAQRRASPQGGLSREAKALLGIGAAIAAVAVVVFFVFAPGDDDPAPAAEAAGGGGAQLVREDSPQAGPADAPVTLVEFLDPECESCGAMYPIVEQIREDYGDRINFVVRYFPLHFNSVLAASAMEAAGRQDRYWDMYSLLFQRQREWGEQRTSQRDLFVTYASELGLDIDTFTVDLDDPAIQAKVERDQRDGVAFGVEGTPTFFINGQMVGSMMTADMLRDRIEAELP
jgi:protein-disulfide isomerase